MKGYLGDFAEDSTLDFKWSSNAADGSSITRGTNGTISVYVGNGATQLTAGVTDTEDFDSTTGVHHCRIDLSADAAYAVGSECQVVLTGAVIDGKTVNTVLAHFSIERTGGALALLKGANGVAAIKAQTAAIETDTQDLQARTPAALVGGRMDASVGAAAANTLTASALAADAVTEIQAGLATAAVAAAIQAKTDNLPSDPADQSLIVAATDAIMGRLGAPAGASLSADIAANLVAIATRLAAASYTAPLDAAGTRGAVGLTAANLETLLTTIDTVVDAIKAKTDSLAFSSGRVNADIKAVNGSTIGENGSGATNWGAV